MKSTNLKFLGPIMLAFFTMGFVDLVGIATNYVKADFSLSDKVANFLPSMVFFWFLICSIPTGLLMNRIGRRKTVLLSLGITVAALAIPMIDYSFTIMMVSFSLLGIGNALMQVSLNPLLSNIISGDRLASSLTFGQFIKAIASFSAPIIAGRAALAFGNWRLLFPIFMLIAILATLWLAGIKIKEEEGKGESSTFTQCFSLLSNKFILLSFIGIMCHVGIDVGTNVTAPKILIEVLGMSLAQAGYATSLYFIFRTLGCFSGSFILTRLSSKTFFGISVLLMLLGMGGLFVMDNVTVVDAQLLIYVCIALIGFGNSNIFPIIFSQVLMCMPSKKNEVSGLMISGLIGGTVFPLIMGYVSDVMMSQVGAIIVMMFGLLYLLSYTLKIKD